MAKEHFIPVTRRGRYFTHGVLGNKTKHIWVVTHGYGQLANFFIKHFEHLDPEENFIIAPEGLSRAYISGMTGRVGASWMTKEMRLTEIEEYTSFISNSFAQATNGFDISSIKVIALGFSQGVATISRWVANVKLRINSVIFWAGEPGKELFCTDAFNNLPILFVSGDKDAYISVELKSQMIEQFKKSNWSFKELTFAGGHQLDHSVISFLETKF